MIMCDNIPPLPYFNVIFTYWILLVSKILTLRFRYIFNKPFEGYIYKQKYKTNKCISSKEYMFMRALI